MNEEETTQKRVVIVGAGLVGSLEALYFAQRGYQVDVYEYRPDPRTQEYVSGRSINLALSCRGREALKAVGAEDHVVSTGIPMHSRMIHSLEGKRTPIPYGKAGQYILSIDRRKLNEKLISMVDSNPRVTYHFKNKFLSANFEKPSITIQNLDEKREEEEGADLIIGADGAFSRIRSQLIRSTRMNYHQFYIPHAYKEIQMPPNENGDYAMEMEYLHIWPRNTFMMIALPNQDKTFTCTLFMPYEIFNSISTEEDIMNFFEKEFPDSIPLIGRKKIVEEYQTNPTGDLISIKCSPYHYKDKVVILGDAAHALVPFYGQGMNCGFEDCLVLNEILDECNGDLAKALPQYSITRNPDAEAIVDLPMYNYLEMREHVNSKLFLLRKMVDNFLYSIFTNLWVPLYTMVTFTRIPYHQAIAKKAKQDEIIRKVNIGSGVLASLLIARFVWNSYNKQGVDVAENTLSTFGSKLASMVGVWCNSILNR